AIVAVNNDGGRIFERLPVAGTEHFERFFATPHGLDLSHAAALAEARLHRPTDVESLRGALGAAIEGGLHIVEVRTDRSLSLRERAGARELGSELPSPCPSPGGRGDSSRR